MYLLRLPLLACAIFAFCFPLRAQEPVSLLSLPDVTKEWGFSNGQEFPGATGGRSADSDVPYQGHPSLKLEGNFTKGGNYVGMGRQVPPTEVKEISLWVRNPSPRGFSFRLNDASGQTHQISLKVEASPDWQQVVLPLERFFATRGQSDAPTGIAQYESWGGAKDGAWHGPLTALHMQISPSPEEKTRVLWIGEIVVVPPRVAAGEEKVTLRQDEVVNGKHGWRFSKGDEFPGAKGELTVAAGLPKGGETSLRLAGDFTGGGAYVAMIREVKAPDAKSAPELHMRYKTSNAKSITVAVVDGTGQTLQRKGVPLEADGTWHEWMLDPAQLAGSEHWGGANDGKWHGVPKQFSFALTNGSDPMEKRPEIHFAEIGLDVMRPVFAQPPAFTSLFDEGPQLAAGWKTEGDVRIDTAGGFKSKGALLLSRTLETLPQACTATSPTFPVAAGQWEIRMAARSALFSPDNSYSATVHLECMDAAGALLEKIPLLDLFKENDWKAETKRIVLPKGAATASVHAQLQKTYGRFWLDSFSAAYLAPPQQKDDRIIRLLFTSAQLGNLLFPEDSRKIQLSLEARRPLEESQKTVTCIVRDYWGAEQTMPMPVSFGKPVQKGEKLIYEGTLDLGQTPLEVGRYYEILATLSQPGTEVFSNFTSFAILPEAITRKYKPEEIPFTSRSWDNRIPDYIRLTDRLGVRICGLWGGWSAKPPYKAEVPGLELARKLGMGWLTNTPCAIIEGGKDEYSEEALRQGARNLVEQFGKERPLFVNLGNEPHGKGEQVRKNVAAYQAVYEEFKKADPSIPVIATSVEPNEEYFQLGYGKWCDAYDFHIYETSTDVRRTMGEYRGLMEKYGPQRPLWSTELGLNSVGQTRHVVAVELYKKAATFFAGGGERMTWFGILYPDPEGKDNGSPGNSHNVFDCRYSHYAPRLDAIAYYNAVNAIAAKKFIEEKSYPGGISAFLFRDKEGQALQILWKENGRADVQIPLGKTGDVEVIRIDGSHRKLDAEGKGVTLSITQDPLLLLYKGGAEKLAPSLNDAPFSLKVEAGPGKGESVFSVSTTESAAAKALAGVKLTMPPFWSNGSATGKEKGGAVAQVRAGKDGGSEMVFTAAPPSTTAAREADFTVTLPGSKGAPSGELYYRVPCPR